MYLYIHCFSVLIYFLLRQLCSKTKLTLNKRHLHLEKIAPHLSFSHTVIGFLMNSFAAYASFSENKKRKQRLCSRAQSESAAYLIERRKGTLVGVSFKA